MGNTPDISQKNLTAGTLGELGPNTDSPSEGLFTFTGVPQRHLPGGPGNPLSPLGPIISCPREQQTEPRKKKLNSPE